MLEENNLVSLDYESGYIVLTIGDVSKRLSIMELKELELSCMTIINQIMEDLK